MGLWVYVFIGILVICNFSYYETHAQLLNKFAVQGSHYLLQFNFLH
jgi:hypothetical protein